MSTGPLRYTFTECLLTSDAKTTFNPPALDIGIPNADNCNKVLAEITKHAFPAYAFCEQKRYLRNYVASLANFND